MKGTRDMAIPTIDIGPLMRGDPDSSDVISSIGQALRDFGFFYISGYDEGDQLAARLFEVGKKVFDLPTEVKNALSIKKSRVFRGYVQKGDDITSLKVDIKEGMYFGHEAPPDEEEEEIFMKGHNLYPPSEYSPDLPEIVDEYMAKMSSIGNELVKALAVNLGQKEDFFDDIYTEPFPLLALWRYPPHPDNEEDWGVGPHTDYGVITLILQDDVGGLQAQTKEGHWVEVSPRPGTLVVLIGDVVEIWTRRYYKAIKHRVKNSPTGTRLSAPFFHQPSAKTIITPLDIVLPSDSLAKSPDMPAPFQFGRYVHNKFRVSYLNS